MKKFGGVILMIVGGYLILASLLRTYGIVMLFSQGGHTAHAIGYLVGMILVVVLFFILGVMAIKKGKSLFTEKPPGI